MPRIGDTKITTAKVPSFAQEASSTETRGKLPSGEKTPPRGLPKPLPMWLDVTTFPRVEEGRWRILRVMIGAGGGACYAVMWGTVDVERSKRVEEAFEKLGWQVTRRTVDLGETGSPPTKRGQAEQMEQLGRLLKFLTNNPSCT